MTAILALGEALIEFVRLPQPVDGHPTYRQGFGGDTSNTIIAAARQGATTGYLSAVGEDSFGKELLELWSREGVDTSTVITRERDPTGVYFVEPHASGRNFTYARRGSAASGYGPDDLPLDAIRKAEVLHVSALSQAISTTMCAAVERACEVAREAGTMVSFDTNLRLNLWSLADAREAIFGLLPLADIVLPSDDEAELLLGTSDQDAVLNRFAAHGARHVILKRGSRGPVLRANGEDMAFEAPSVEAVDSTGAGDSFAGAFLTYFLETKDARLAVERAVKVAARTVSGYGAVDPLPYRADIL
ncbi:MAG: sugar kinase [Pseudomonadota bacterium]